MEMEKLHDKRTQRLAEWWQQTRSTSQTSGPQLTQAEVKFRHRHQAEKLSKMRGVTSAPQRTCQDEGARSVDQAFSEIDADHSEGIVHDHHGNSDRKIFWPHVLNDCVDNIYILGISDRYLQGPDIFGPCLL
jgi:hypothetical protein